MSELPLVTGYIAELANGLGTPVGYLKVWRADVHRHEGPLWKRTHHVENVLFWLIRWSDGNPDAAWDDGDENDVAAVEHLDDGRFVYAGESFPMRKLAGAEKREIASRVFRDETAEEWGPPLLD